MFGSYKNVLTIRNDKENQNCFNINAKKEILFIKALCNIYSFLPTIQMK